MTPLCLNRRARLISVGTSVPENVLTNKDLEKILDTSDEWITSRTGIRERHVYPPGVQAYAYELGACAARNALERARMNATEIDAVICATFTPDYFFPSTACKIQGILGCKGACAFDISAACAGFIYGLSLANSLIVSGQCTSVLLVGAEIISKTLNWQDRSTAILFGDGAGAVVIRAGEPGDEAGILSTYMSSDGTLGEILCLPAWGEKRYMKMNGGEVFRHAVRLMSDATRRVLDSAGIPIDQVDLFIPHQANIRIMQAIAVNVGLPLEKLVSNLDRYGNTSSASIPLALEEAWNSGRIGPGTVAAFSSLGGGIAIGSAVIRF